jgi:acetoin utilization deacetylase AcuC-like enzyme
MSMMQFNSSPKQVKIFKMGWVNLWGLGNKSNIAQSDKMNSKVIFYIPDYGNSADANMIKRNLILAERIQSDGIGEVILSRSASDDEVMLFHASNYIDAVKTGYPLELASSGQHWYESIYEDKKKCVGAILDAIDESLVNGISGALCSGGHHALPDQGGALGVLNGIGIGIMYAKNKVNKIMMLDLDMHFSNGTTIGLSNVEDIFLFDYHGHASNFNRPDTPHLFRNLAEEPYGGFYLNMLRKELPAVIEQFKPDLCIYLSGMDVYKGSQNAKLFLSEKDIKLREEIVFNQFAERKIPIAYMHGGGYFSEETAANFHYMTAKASVDAFLKFYSVAGAEETA